MKKWFWLVVLLWMATIAGRTTAVEISKDQWATAFAAQPACNPWVDYGCAPPKISPKKLRAMERSGNCDPYIDYKCLDAYLGNDFFTRFYRYYALEWGHAVAPSDSNAAQQSDTQSADDSWLYDRLLTRCFK